MALIGQSFAERYAELVARVPTHTELLLDLQRREVGERKALEEKCQVTFQDVLHVAAVMIADKKALGRGALANRNRFEVALYKKQTAVWFQAAPPRKVEPSITRPLHGFPHAAFEALCQEERELRQWHYGVERRLREHIEEACGRAWFFLNMVNDAIRSESLSRQRLQHEEDESFIAAKQSFFRAVPADYYRNVVIARYGQTDSAIEQAKDLTFEEVEEKVRAGLMEEEEASWRSAYQYLYDMYDVQLFSLNHREVLGRYELEEEERNTLFPLILRCCREDFGILFYHVPALALHFNSSQPCLRALCVTQLEEAPKRTAATRSRFSWIPAFDLVGMASELGFDEHRGEIENGVEGETQEAEGSMDGGDDSYNAAPPPVDDMPHVATDSTMVFEAELGCSEVPGPETEHEESEVPEPGAEGEESEVPGAEAEREESEVPEPEAEGEESEVPGPEAEREESEVPGPEAELEESEVPGPEAEDEELEVPEPEAEREESEVAEPEAELEELEVPGAEAEGEELEVDTPPSGADPLVQRAHEQSSSATEMEVTPEPNEAN